LTDSISITGGLIQECLSYPCSDRACFLSHRLIKSEYSLESDKQSPFLLYGKPLPRKAGCINHDFILQKNIPHGNTIAMRDLIYFFPEFKKSKIQEF